MPDFSSRFICMYKKIDVVLDWSLIFDGLLAGIWPQIRFLPGFWWCCLNSDLFYCVCVLFFLNRCQWYFRKCLHWFLFPKVVERHFPLVAFASSSTLNCFSWRGVMMNCFCDPSYREKPNPWLKRIFVVYRLVTCVTVNVYFLRSRVF